MRIDPAINNVEEGQPLIVNVMIDGAVNVGAFQFDLIYDPAVVTVTDVALGPFVGSTGRTAQPVGPTIDNRAGTLAFGAFSFGSTAGPAGAGVLATVRFRAEGPGTSVLGLQNVVVTDPMANTQPASVEGGVVTVTAPPAASTPTMAPSPTVIPTAMPTLGSTATATQIAGPMATATPTGAAEATATSPIATTTATPVATEAPTPGGPSTSTPAETPQPQATVTSMPSSTPGAVLSQAPASTPRPPEGATAIVTATVSLPASPTPSSRLIDAVSRPLCWVSVGAMLLLGVVVGGCALCALLGRYRE